MKKLIVYGLGNAWEANKNYIGLHNQICGYSDAKIKETNGNFIKPSDLRHSVNGIDYILITSIKYKDSILVDLEALGIPKEKILDIRKLYKQESDAEIEEIDAYFQKSKQSFQSGDTSITDVDTHYKKAVYAAFLSDNFFEHFRSLYGIRNIYEHVSIPLGLKCIDEIEKKTTFPRNMMQEFLRNDDVGKPPKWEFTLFGNNICAAPTTLRYMKIAGDIIDHFDVTKLENIAEIGVGYGGQGRILSAYLGNTLKKYSLIDLPEVLSLSSKYLTALHSEKQFAFIDGTKPITEKEYDLVISNYAFSELYRKIQDKYLDEVILHAKHGYVIWNSLSYKLLDGYSVTDLLGKIPNSRVEDEKPLTGKGNCIIIW